MTELTSHLTEGAQLTETSSGFTLSVTFLLEDVPGTGAQQQYFALQDARIPRIGDGHPVVPGISVLSRAVEPVDDTIMRISVEYGVPDTNEQQAYEIGQAPGPEGTISVSAAVSSEETQFDIAGRPLKVAYTGKLTDDDGNPVEVKNEEQVATVEIQRPEMIVNFTRKERGSPLFFAVEAVGKVNLTDLGIYRRGTLLLTRIDADSDDNGITFNVTYEFQYRPPGWAVTIVYTDPQTDRPPVDVDKGALGDGSFGLVSGNGLAQYEVYDVYDFGAFRLPF